MLVDVVPRRVPGERQHRVPGDAQRVWGVTIPDKLSLKDNKWLPKLTSDTHEALL